jgi:hypothetical protein
MSLMCLVNLSTNVWCFSSGTWSTNKLPVIPQGSRDRRFHSHFSRPTKLPWVSFVSQTEREHTEVCRLPDGPCATQPVHTTATLNTQRVHPVHRSHSSSSLFHADYKDLLRWLALSCTSSWSCTASYIRKNYFPHGIIHIHVLHTVYSALDDIINRLVIVIDMEQESFHTLMKVDFRKHIQFCLSKWCKTYTISLFIFYMLLLAIPYQGWC